MGSPTSETPSSLPPGPAVSVSSVMAGQEWVDPNGETHLAAYDCVLLQFLDPLTGLPMASLTQTPDSAIKLATIIQHHAVQLINTEVGDDGRKLSLSQRLSRISAAHRDAKA